MTTRAKLPALCAVFFFMTQPALGEEPGALTLSTMVAGLQRLQDKMAAGDRLALKAHSAALKSIGAAIEASPQETWDSESERVAATIYLLSGGSPASVAQKLRSDAFSGEKVEILGSALAFVTSRRGEARKLLGGFDARQTDLRLAGQLAYVQAELAVGESPEKALASLDLARLLAPGGLVEEAALRRELGIASSLGDGEKFLSLARQYARRFARSAYFDSFQQILAAGVDRMSLNDDFSNLEKYKSLAAELPAAQKHLLFLAAARSALLGGHTNAAQYFSREALKEAPLDSHEQARAQFYQAAARILLEDDPGASSDLQAVPRAQLDQKDLNLLAAVRRVAAALHAEAPQAVIARQEANEGRGNGLGERAIAAAEATILRAYAIGKEDEARAPEARAP
jgi:chemotaxis protein MotC